MTPDRKTEFDHENDDPVIGVSVHITDKVNERNGRTPEHTVVQYLAQALDHAEQNYEIDFNFPVKEPDTADEMRFDRRELYRWWRDRVNDDPGFEPRKDSNILLTDRDFGGLGATGGWVAVTSARHISEYTRHEWTASGGDDQGKNVFGTLHEFSHNLGMRHDPHWGNGWNEGGKWHRTITVSANGKQNLCGEWVEKRQHEREVRYFFFHDCAKKNFRITDEEPLGPAADEPQLPDPPHEPPKTPDPPKEPPERSPPGNERDLEDILDEIDGIFSAERTR